MLGPSHVQTDQFCTSDICHRQHVHGYAVPSGDLEALREEVQQLKGVVEVLTNATHLMAIPTAAETAGGVRPCFLSGVFCHRLCLSCIALLHSTLICSNHSLTQMSKMLLLCTSCAFIPQSPASICGNDVGNIAILSYAQHRHLIVHENAVSSLADFTSVVTP